MTRCNCKVNPKDYDPNNVPLDCPLVWDMLAAGHTKGVFQLESQLGKTWCQKLQPKSIRELADVISVIRPGTLEAMLEDKSLTRHFADRKNKKEEVPSFHKIVDSILKDTYGIMCYQEQAIEIVKQTANFSLLEAEKLRKSCGKKDSKLMAEVEKLYIEKVKQANVIDEILGQNLFDWIKKSQRYSFNKCVSGDTIIKRMDKGKHKCILTVEEMYLIRNDIKYAKQTKHLSLYKKWKLRKNYCKGLSLNSDGRIRSNDIIDIKPAGKKIVFKVELSNGSYIRVTNNHKFPTINGEKELNELKIGDKLYFCGRCDLIKPKKYGYSNVTIEERKNRSRKKNKKINHQFGKDNFGYTNGSWSEFNKNNKIIPRECELCGKKDGKLELHHKDGDRTNSHITNLQRLCSGCHKREEYKLGRVKKGQKGYPTLEIDIISIKEDGVCMTYDVTMSAPNHNFVANDGVVTCNSHAISYAINGYICAWTKSHFPLQFFTAWLSLAHEKGQKYREELAQLVDEAKLFDIKVLGPSLLSPQARCHIVDDCTVRIGLQDIKEIGSSAVLKIAENIKEIEAAAGKSWYSLMSLLDKTLSSEVLDNLISAGALDFLKLPRKRLLFDVAKWRQLTEREQKFVEENGLSEDFRRAVELLSESDIPNKNRRQIIKGIAHQLQSPPFSLEDDFFWKSTEEDRLIGVSLSCIKLDGISIEGNTTCADIKNGNVPKKGILVAEFKSAKAIKIKKGKSKGLDMHFLSVRDNSGICDNLAIFPDSDPPEWGLLAPGTICIIYLEKGYTGGPVVKRIEIAS